MTGKRSKNPIARALRDRSKLPKVIPDKRRAKLLKAEKRDASKTEINVDREGAV